MCTCVTHPYFGSLSLIHTDWALAPDCFNRWIGEFSASQKQLWARPIILTPAQKDRFDTGIVDALKIP